MPDEHAMAPPHLHPRSRMTSSLFATTVILSFLVVVLPHVLPCPAPRVVYADGEMVDSNGRRRRRRKPQEAEAKEGIVQFENMGGNENSPGRIRRECPVPKPGGVVGELLGFTRGKGGKDDSR